MTLGEGDGRPEPFVLEHQALPVDLQLGLEVVLRVPVAVLPEARVALDGALEAELGPDEPRHGDLLRLAHLEPEPPDGQRVRRRREAEIYVDAVLVPGRALLA